MKPSPPVVGHAAWGATLFCATVPRPWRRYCDLLGARHLLQAALLRDPGRPRRGLVAAVDAAHAAAMLDAVVDRAGARARWTGAAALPRPPQRRRAAAVALLESCGWLAVDFRELARRRATG